MPALLSLSRRSLLPITFGLLALARPAAAQIQPADTARSRPGISYSEETVPDSTGYAFEAGLGRRLRRLTRVQVEERRLWKLDPFNFELAQQGGQLREFSYGPHLLYEHKLRTSWSVLLELTPAVVRYRERYNGPTFSGLDVQTQTAGRYYYNLRKRIRKGKSASNFSANYLSVALGAGYGRHGYRTPFSEAERGHAVRASVAVLYGLQRRLGRYGFVDFNAGLPLPLLPAAGPLFPNNTLHIRLDLRVGLALGR
ncbi:hypothetical protein SAMN02745146_1843 [Hymenobacter daecheongensis DSM 21074]|uniref:Outer membrane protein beta-barrel domain-containing protein n=1 Tax=Hymenobacter daecheongensis DSM 21074 TaxID=1121955 RepID=A0A1M6EWD2_9BACT|nr:hypothetical protein [Hymenobacter daecheongensis]SHI89797.1 hypothetical protein SAMN02745146_1843 [Hymenobacter daecheongensis DSM 21074]